VSTSSASTAQKRLKNELRIEYGFAPCAISIGCSVLMRNVVNEFVSCAHLVPRQLREVWPLLGITDELRNVLLMFKCVEEAYDVFVLSLLWTQEKDVEGRTLYRIHVWDPALRLLPVTMNVRKRGSPRYPGIIMPDLDGLTFGDLHGQLRQLHSPQGHVPYRRSLAFQAQLARAKALFSKWEVVDVDMEAALSPEVTRQAGQPLGVV
jgi:hypothetical protein